MIANNEDLHYLIYVSKAVVPFDDAMLQNILSESRSWNGKHHLTGILMYHNSNIMQVLEGSAKELDFIFEKIKGDKRHTGVHKVAGKKIENRSFSKWSMAFRTADETLFDRVSFEAYNDPLNRSLLPDEEEPDNSILSLINIFIAINPIST